MSDKATTVLEYGDAASRDAFVVAGLDAVLNADAEGNARSSFAPGEEIYLFVHHDGTVRVNKIIPSLPGTITPLGGAVRKATEQHVFKGYPDNANDLGYIAAGLPSAVWYGRSSVLGVSGSKVKANPGYCIGDLTYNYLVELYRYTPGSAPQVAEDETFPLRFFVNLESKNE